MTILCRIERPDYELTVCGTVTPEWLDWLRTADVPLTAAQWAWREPAESPGVGLTVLDGSEV